MYLWVYGFRFTCDQTILYPGALRVIMTLLPHVFTAEDPQVTYQQTDYTALSYAGINAEIDSV